MARKPQRGKRPVRYRPGRKTQLQVYSRYKKRDIADIVLNEFPNLKVEKQGVAPLSNTIPGGGGYRKDIDDYKWKQNTESTGTIKEIERKKTRLAPLYNKGTYQYITDETDTKTLGRKI